MAAEWKYVGAAGVLSMMVGQLCALLPAGLIRSPCVAEVGCGRHGDTWVRAQDNRSVEIIRRKTVTRGGQQM